MLDSLRRADYSPPQWVLDSLADGADVPVSDRRHPIRKLVGERFFLLSTAIPNAAERGAEELERIVGDSYLRLLEQANRLSTSHLVRVWNLIPGILEPLGGVQHRYLVFNAGRFRAYREWYGERFYERAPTASSVGAPGGELVIHALASAEESRPLQNPRQRPSHRYSDSYGPSPPCFARAVLIGSAGTRRWLVVGGTASIRGEETMHPGNLEAQAGETLLNLATLVDVGHGCSNPDIGLDDDAIARRLRRFRSLRVYYVDAGSLNEITSCVSSRFHQLEQVEYVRTELCRDDLLIEIEGVAELG